MLGPEWTLRYWFSEQQSDLDLFEKDQTAITGHMGASLGFVTNKLCDAETS